MGTIVTRAWDMLVDPGKAWADIAQSGRRLQYVRTLSYAVAVCVLPLLVSSAKAVLFGQHMRGTGTLLLSTVTSLTLSLSLVAGIHFVAWVLHLLGPLFGASRSYRHVFALIGYSATPYVIGILTRMAGAPAIAGLLFTAYSVFLVVRGIPAMTGCPGERAPAYALVAVLTLLGTTAVGAFASVFYISFL